MKVGETLLATVQALPPQVNNLGKNETLEDVFKLLFEKRPEIRNALHEALINKSPGLVHVFGLKGNNYKLNISLSENRWGIKVHLEIEKLATGENRYFDDDDLSTIFNRKVALFNHETGFMNKTKSDDCPNGKFTQTFYINNCHEEPPAYLKDTMEKVFPNPWISKAGFPKSPPYLSLVELKE